MVNGQTSQEHPSAATHIIQFQISGSSKVISQYINALDEFWTEEARKSLHKDEVTDERMVLNAVTELLTVEIAQVLADPWEASPADPGKSQRRLFSYDLESRDGDHIVVAEHVAAAQVVDIHIRGKQ